MVSNVELNLIEYVKKALERGYSDEEIKKILKQHDIDNSIIQKVISEAKENLRSESTYERISPIMIVISSLVIMFCIYIIKAMSESSDLGPFLTVLNGLWPLLFPMTANIINYRYFRKSFYKGMIITFSILFILIIILVLLIQLGL